MKSFHSWTIQSSTHCLKYPEASYARLENAREAMEEENSHEDFLELKAKVRLKGFEIQKTLQNHLNGLHFKGSENVEEIPEVFRIPHDRRQNDVPKTVEQLGQNHHHHDR